MRKLWILFSLGSLFWACAPGPKSQSADERSKVSLDRGLARLMATGKLDSAQRITDSLRTSMDPLDREIAAYWICIHFLYLDEPDSALTILEPHEGKWNGSLRRVHSEVLLRLAREASQGRVASRRLQEDQQSKLGPERVLQERVETLQKETGELRAEIARLGTERLKYQKLIKDLEAIR